MAQLYELVRNASNQKVLRYNLHEGQLKAYNSKARFIMVLAGAQSGKTSYGPIWLYKEIQACGAGDYIAATASYDLLKLKMLPELRNFFCRCLGWKYEAQDRIITNARHGIRIIMRSAESPGGLESATAKGAWCDEWGQNRVTAEHQEAIERRLSLFMGRQLVTTTPYNLGFLKVMHDRAVGGDSKYEVINFESRMNPNFSQEEWDRLESTMPRWKFDMFYRGLFVRPAGLIYSDFLNSYVQDGGHVIRAFRIPNSWDRQLGVDFGPVNTAIVWGAYGMPESVCGEHVGFDVLPGDLFIYRTTMLGRMTPSDYAREIKAYNEPVIKITGGAKSEEQWRMDWAIAGQPVVEPRISDVEAGIDRVIRLLKVKRLFVFDTLNMLRQEFATYSRELDAAGEATEKIADKQKFHCLDALRYLCTSIPRERPDLPEIIDIPGDSRRLVDIRTAITRRHPQVMLDEYR